MNKMINIFLHISLLLLPFLVYAQHGGVGINNSNPKATLDISATPNSNIAIDGMSAPRIKGSELKSNNSQYVAYGLNHNPDNYI